jgi:hypothetical protein
MRLFICLFALAVSQAASAAVLNFEGIGNQGSFVPNGYGGFNWSNMRLADGSRSATQGSGYDTGRVSGNFTTYNSGGATGSTATMGTQLFNFEGAYLTAAWNTGLNIQVKGFLDGVLQYDTTVIVDTTGPTWFDFSYAGIDFLEFRSFGGVDAGPDSGSGTQFAMDNFSYSVVPIPAAVWLFASALAGLGWIRRKHSA